MSLKNIEGFRGVVYTDPNLNRILGIFHAYIRKNNVSLNWVYGQITKAHNLIDAKKVFDAFENELASINFKRTGEVKRKLFS